MVASDTEEIINDNDSTSSSLASYEVTDSAACEEAKPHEDVLVRSQMSTWQWTKLRCVKRQLVTVEINAFFMMLCMSMYGPIGVEFIYYRTCLDKYDSELVCANLDMDVALADREAWVQKAAANFASYNNIFTVFSVIGGVILGSWLDKFSSTLPLLLPTLGNVCRILLLAAISYFRLPLWLYFVQSTIASVFGGMLTVTSANYYYLSMTTTPGERSLRFGLLEACATIGEVAGSALIGFLAPHNEYTFAFLVLASLYVVQSIYIVALIPELHSKAQVRKNRGDSSWLSFLFTWQNFAGVFTVPFLKRGWYQTKHIACITVSFWAYLFVVNCYYSLLFPFLAAPPVGVTHVVFSFYQIALSVAGFIGNTAILFLFKSVMKLRDSDLALIGVLSWCGYFGTIAIHTVIATWASVIWKLFQSYTNVGLRSILSQQVAEDERGKMFAFLGMSEAVAGVVGGLIGAKVYALTFDVFIGYTWVFLAGVFLIAAILVIVVRFDIERLKKGVNFAIT